MTNLSASPLSAPAKVDSHLFGPIAFWASFLSFIISVIYTFYSLIPSTQDNTVKYLACALLFFFNVYLLRIYMGLLFVTYDSSIGDVLRRLPPAKRCIFHVFVFTEMALCLAAPTAFSALGIKGGHNIVLIESIILSCFWLAFYKEFLKKDRDGMANWITLVLDILAVFPLLLLLFVGDHWDGSLQTGLLIGFSFLYLAISMVEFALVYSGAVALFYASTKILCSR